MAREANRTEFSPSAHGGEQLRSVVELRQGKFKSFLSVNFISFFISPRARPEDDGRTFECSAHNPTIEEPHARAAKVNLVVLCESGFGDRLTAAKQTKKTTITAAVRRRPRG